MEEKTGQEMYEETAEGKAMNTAGDLIYEAFQKMEEAAKLMECAKDVEVLRTLIDSTKAQADILGDLSDTWTEQVFKRIVELYPSE